MKIWTLFYTPYFAMHTQCILFYLGKWLLLLLLLMLLLLMVWYRSRYGICVLVFYRHQPYTAYTIYTVRYTINSQTGPSTERIFNETVVTAICPCRSLIEIVLYRYQSTLCTSLKRMIAYRFRLMLYSLTLNTLSDAPYIKLCRYKYIF